MLAALSEALGDAEPFDGFSARKLRNYYLLNPEETGERHYKLLLSQTDKVTLTSIVDRNDNPFERSLRVTQNYKLFRDLIASRQSDFVAVCSGLAKLVVVDIALSRDQDNPQLIFESMNSTGRELSQADLIRNFILMGLEPELQTRLYEQSWWPMEGGFKQSPLRVNAGLGDLDEWNENTIKSHASKLAARASDVWQAPLVPADVLAAYQRETAKATGYSIADHAHLLNSPTRELFDAFRQEILKLDPCVSEEFLKLYVAYKAETNFVDVVPQAKQLQLSLNMGFVDINDPRGMCKDVSGLGRWGNGDVEVRFTALDELPYVIGLVRQSLERQLGNGG